MIRRDHRGASNCPICDVYFELFRLVQHQKSITGRGGYVGVVGSFFAQAFEYYDLRGGVPHHEPSRAISAPWIRSLICV